MVAGTNRKAPSREIGTGLRTALRGYGIAAEQRKPSSASLQPPYGFVAASICSFSSASRDEWSTLNGDSKSKAPSVPDANIRKTGSPVGTEARHELAPKEP